LVVIAVITILAALLLPALSRSKVAARSVVCKSNLHQISIGMGLYLSENAEYPLFVTSARIPPPWAPSFSPVPAFGTVAYWPEELKPYTHDIRAWGGPMDSGLLPPGAPNSRGGGYEKGLFVCPDYYGPACYGLFAESSLFNYNPENLMGAYGYNALGMTGVAGGGGLWPGELGLGGRFPVGGISQWPTLDFQLLPCREGAVIKPAAMLAVADANILDAGIIGGMGYLDFHVGGTAPYTPHQSGMFMRGTVDWEARRHNRQFNTAFCDGHVSSVRREKLFDWRDYSALRQWNTDNQPHPELIVLNGRIPY
jgi:prepilin-type processing-associated H-X9-DG protein